MDALWHGRFRYLRTTLALIAGGGWLLTLAGFLGRVWWPLEVISHFRWQYFVFLAIWTVLLAVGRLWRTAAVTLFFALVNLGLLLPFYVRRDSPPAEPLARVLWVNVRKANEQPQRLVRLIEEQAPDIVVMGEVTPSYLQGLAPLEEDYPHRVQEDVEAGSGLALLSRLPPQEATTADIGEHGVPTVIVRLRPDGAAQTFLLVATHPPPPRGGERLEIRTSAMRALADWVRAQEEPVVVVGDFNITAWSPYFRSFLEDARLNDARLGHGLQNSWPVLQPLLRIPIDQALVSDGVAVHGFVAGPDVGSDHYPIFLDFSLREEEP